MSQVIAGTVESVKAIPAKVDTSAVTEPVAKAGRHVYGRASEGVQWYLEQLEDLLHEAEVVRTQKFAKEGLAVDDILAGLNEAKVASSIPGRVRLRVEQLKRQNDVAKQTEQALAGRAGINQVEVNHLTGSVLVMFDKAKYPSLDSLLEAIKPSSAQPESPAEEEPPSAKEKPHARKRKATKGES